MRFQMRVSSFEFDFPEMTQHFVTRDMMTGVEQCQQHVRHIRFAIKLIYGKLVRFDRLFTLMALKSLLNYWICEFKKFFKPNYWSNNIKLIPKMFLDVCDESSSGQEMVRVCLLYWYATYHITWLAVKNAWLAALNEQKIFRNLFLEFSHKEHL